MAKLSPQERRANAVHELMRRRRTEQERYANAVHELMRRGRTDWHFTSLGGAVAKLSPQKRYANAVHELMRRGRTDWKGAQALYRPARAARGVPLSAHWVHTQPRAAIADVVRAVGLKKHKGRLVLYDAGPGRKGEEVGFQAKDRFGEMWEGALRRAFGDRPFLIQIRTRELHAGDPEPKISRHEGLASSVAEFWPAFHGILRSLIARLYKKDAESAANDLSINVRTIVAVAA